MRTETEVIIHPYDGANGRSILHRLIMEFDSARWTHFRGAVHFARQSGNYQELLDAMGRFLRAGSRLHVTFGADVFGAAGQATDYDAILQLLQAFRGYPTFELFLYHEPARTFHPKLYLFSHEPESALLLVGSSNWSEGGFHQNVEVNVAIHFDLTDEEHRTQYARIVECIETVWQERQ